jgi:parvulin-like peptidyl-prolyl isomerase
MRLSLVLCVLIIFINPYLPAQQDRVVAEVGPFKIYESEFRDRFDFSAHPNLLQKRDEPAAKEEFLHQLIAEKLLSLDARAKGYDTTNAFRKIMTPLSNMFLRDALYTKEIKDKTEYDPADINEGKVRIKKVLTLGFIFSDSKDEITYIFNKLKTGASFDSLLMGRREQKDNPKKITFGDMEKPVEDAVYSLREGQFTTPINSGGGYYILKLLSEDNNTDLKTQESVNEDVKKIVQTRAEYKRYLEYYRSYLSNFRVTADKEIFEDLIRIFVPAFNEKYGKQNSVQVIPSEDKTQKYYLKGDEVYAALDKMDDKLRNKTFIKIKDDPVRPNFFLYQLSQDGFSVRDIGEMSIRSSLSAYIRKFIEDQLFTAEGYKEGLENTPAVKKDLGMWEDSYLSKLIKINMFDSIRVSEKQAYSVYKMNDWKESMPPLVNIAEVLTDSLSVAETVLNKLSQGFSIQELAKRYTKRDSLRDRGGEFGYFDMTQHGEIGRIASQLNVGEVYGPLKTDEGYSIFKVIDKKEDSTSYTKSFDEVKDQLIAKITLAKFQKYVNNYNAQLAARYGVVIYDNVLSSIKDIYMNLVVARRMGFGGEIYAFPYTEEYTGWYDIWMKNKNIIQ